MIQGYNMADSHRLGAWIQRGPFTGATHPNLFHSIVYLHRCLIISSSQQGDQGGVSVSRPSTLLLSPPCILPSPRGHSCYVFVCLFVSWAYKPHASPESRQKGKVYANIDSILDPQQRQVWETLRSMLSVDLWTSRSCLALNNGIKPIPWKDEYHN